MAREDERRARAQETILVGGLPEAPGILAAMGLSPGLAAHLQGLADTLLVNEFPGTSLSRSQRELLATAVSAANDCFFCMDSHGAFARELLHREGSTSADVLVDGLKEGASTGLDPRMTALVRIARIVAKNARELRKEDVDAALSVGANDADIQLAVLIASAFCMYNRMVDGFRASTPPTVEPYRETAAHIADRGYRQPPPPR